MDEFVMVEKEEENELNNIIADIVPDENIFYFQEHEIDDLFEICLHLIDEFIEVNKQELDENWEEELNENVLGLLLAMFDDDIFFNEDSEEELLDILHHAKEHYFFLRTDIQMPERTDALELNERTDALELNERTDAPELSESSSDIEMQITENDDNITSEIAERTDAQNELTDKINRLRAEPQPTQRTREWYEFRQNLITASNAYKAFESQRMQNSLIYEKCQPLQPIDENTKEVTVVNTNTSLHWGQKYESLSVMLYEEKFQTKIEDFGCLRHPKYSFLGASPDGINVDIKSPLYGRMLEIKNVVSREITGIPKKEYWIQMQLQMEVCDLDECDFLETKFVELEEYNPLGGIIIHFHKKEDGKPFYVIKPFDIVDPGAITEWQNKMLDEYSEYLFVKYIYWKMEKFSCVLVKRDKQWFQEHIGQLTSIWKTIEEERISGYEHRAPNKRLRREQVINNEKNPVCLLKPKINVIKVENDIL
jgi:putative phage-type endonuclease